MTKKIIAVIVIGISIAALIALMWWWFFNRPSQVPTQTGSFGSAQNRGNSNGGTGVSTDLSAPVVRTTGLASKVTKGKYNLQTLNGANVGSYQIDPNADTGTVTVTPVDSSQPLQGGTYILNIDGVTVGDYVFSTGGTGEASNNYTFTIEAYDPGGSVLGSGGTQNYTNNNSGYGTGGGTTYNPNNYSSNGSTTLVTDTEVGPGEFLSVPPIDFTPVTPAGGSNLDTNSGGGSTAGGTGGGAITVTTPGSVGIGGGLDFSGQSAGTIFNTDGGIGTIPNIGPTGGDNGGGGLGIGGAVIGAVAAGAAACVLPALALAIGGSLAIAIFGKSTAVTGATAAGGGATVAGTAAGVAAATVAAEAGLPTSDVATRAAVAANTAATAGAATAVAGNAAATAGNATIGTASAIATNLGLAIDLDRVITDKVLNCFARAVARAALEQIARSTIQWINSGFNGSPSFVSNYNQFFTNVADRAAGQFLQSSALSFMCSPFSLKVKIAIANSYAHGGGAGNQQCTLTGVVGNINNFMNGNFSAGGWPGLLSFMGEPTNNPYGAYAYGSIGIQSAAGSAKATSGFDLSLSGGFLSIKQQKNCKNYSSQDSAFLAQKKGQTATQLSDPGDRTKDDWQVCDEVNITPGTAIAQSLDKALGIGPNELSTAKYFDEIIGALISQMVQKISTVGLGNLSSGNNGYVSTNTQVTTSGIIQQSVLQNIPNLQQSAQQLNKYSSENIDNIKTVLTQANNLRSCWVALAAASSTPSSKQFEAQQKVFGVDGLILNLNNKITGNQSTIDKDNANVSDLQNYTTQSQSTTDVAQLENIMSSLASKVQNGYFTQDTDVVNAQENQIVLNGELDAKKAEIAKGLDDCSKGNISDTTNTTPAPTQTVNYYSNTDSGGGN